jgi:hypothetical protein
MNTPQDEFDTIIIKFNDALSRMGPGMGDPVTRGERALLKTFFIFIQKTNEAPAEPPSPSQAEPQSPE